MERKTLKKNGYVHNFPFIMGTLLLFLAICRAFILILIYGDIYPQWDEWLFVPAHGSFFRYIVLFNNENLQVFTNLSFWLVEKLGGQFSYARFVSFFIYLWMCGVSYMFFRTFLSERNRIALIFLYLILFSDYLTDLLTWPNLSQIWFYFGFMFSALYYGFVRPQNLKNMFFLYGCCVLMALSMNITFVIMIGLVYAGKLFYDAYCQKKITLLLSAIIWSELVSLLVMCFWFAMRHNDTTAILFSRLFTVDFYYWLSYALFAVFFGFFISADNEIFWLCFGVLYLIYVAVLCLRALKYKSRWGIISAITVVLGGLVAIVLFRGDLLLLLTEHAGRYMHYGVFFILSCFVLGCLDDNKCIRRINYFLGSIFLLCNLCNFTGNRVLVSADRIKNAKICIESFYNQETRPAYWNCAGKYWENIAPKLIDFENVFLKK